MRSYTSGKASRTSSMCAAGSLPVGEGMPPVRRIQRRMRGRLMPCMFTSPRNCRRRCGAPRMSIHRTQPMSAFPWRSTGTVPSPCVLQQTATTSAEGPSWPARSRRVAPTSARHQSPGSCSAPPPAARAEAQARPPRPPLARLRRSAPPWRRMCPGRRRGCTSRRCVAPGSSPPSIPPRPAARCGPQPAGPAACHSGLSVELVQAATRAGAR